MFGTTPELCSLFSRAGLTSPGSSSAQRRGLDAEGQKNLKSPSLAREGENIMYVLLNVMYLIIYLFIVARLDDVMAGVSKPVPAVS